MGDKDDDEGTVDVSINVVRYNIMPSLVALQTMRNRLHLAFLGKKLMKWTALATGKELRRLSMEISGLFVDYGSQCREAFVKLARCRYFKPAINLIVLECCPKKARVTIQMSTRSVAGVKVISLGVVESGQDGYSLLGLGKGGGIIKESINAWHELLTMMVLMCQFRITFMMVHAANQAATKKQNVLQRLIIPKIHLTMRYILSELEEQEREETFRLKRFKQLKYKYDSAKKHPAEIEEPEPKKEPKEKPKLEEPKLEEPKLEEPEPEPVPPPTLPTDEELIIVHMKEVVRLAEIIQNAALTPQNFGLTNCDLGKLQMQLHDMLILSKTSREKRECVECKGSQCLCPASCNQAPPCENLEVLRPPGYEAALKLMPTTKVATPMPEYIMQPQGKDKPDYKPDTAVQDNDRLNDLQNHIDRVICLTHCYKQDGVLSQSAEDFLKCCQNVKTKIEEMKEKRKISAKINRLKWEIEHLEQVTDTIQKEGLTCDSISSFISCCKDFKTKLEIRQSTKGVLPSVCSIVKLLERIDVSIELSNEAKMEGLVNESVEEFIKTCKEIKAKIDTQEVEVTTPKVINDLRGNLNDIMKVISKYKHDGLLSDSIEKFYITCESTKAKLDDYKPVPGVKLNECQMTTIKRESRHAKTTKKLEKCPTCQKDDDNLKISSTKSACSCSSCKQSSLPKEKSDPVNTTCCPIASRHGSQDKYSYSKDCVNICKCASLQESAPSPTDTCSCNSEKGYCTAKFYENCPKCIKPQLPACQTIETSSKGAVSIKDPGTCKVCSRVFISVVLPSNFSQSNVPELNKPTCCQITTQQPSKTCIQLMRICKSLQNIALDETKCKECDDNKDQNGGTVSMMILTKFKNTAVNSVKDSNSVPRKSGSCESVKSTKKVCNAPTTKGLIQIVRNVKSEKLIRTQDLSESYSAWSWSHNSAETLKSQNRNTESEEAQLDPFFCGNSTTSHDNSEPDLPL